MDQASTSTKENPQTAATVQGRNETNIHGGLKMKTNVSPASSAVTHNFNPTVYHYHRRTDISFAQVTGASITALCGDQGKIGATSSDGQASSVVVCPLCAMLYAELPVRAA